MKWKFEVTVNRLDKYQVVVEAPDDRLAYHAAHATPAEEMDLVSDEEYRIVTVTEQVGGPFFHPGGFRGEGRDYKDVWYDLHGPGDVIVLETKLGEVWTQELVDLIRGRLKLIGLTFLEYWNGYDKVRKRGHRQVSFKVAGRKGEGAMTESDRAILLQDPV